MEVAGVPQGRCNLVLNTQQGNATARRSQKVQLENDAEVDAARSTSSLVVTGILRVEDGSPVPQPARVLLRNSSTGESVDVAVSAAGDFSFKDSPGETGNYELMIIEPQRLFTCSLASANAKTSAPSLELANPPDRTVTTNTSKGNS